MCQRPGLGTPTSGGQHIKLKMEQRPESRIRSSWLSYQVVGKRIQKPVREQSGGYWAKMRQRLESGIRSSWISYQVVGKGFRSPHRASQNGTRCLQGLIEPKTGQEKCLQGQRGYTMSDDEDLISCWIYLIQTQVMQCLRGCVEIWGLWWTLLLVGILDFRF